MKAFRAATVAILAVTLSPLQAAAAQQAQAASAEDGKALKCKRIKEVGSRIPKKVCRTEAEWKELERESVEALRSSQSRSSSCGDSSIC